jgi:hypothetical protein
MPRKSKPKPDQASNSSKVKQAHPNNSSSGPSSKRRKITHENDSTPNNPESAQAPLEPSEVESPVATSKLNTTARHTRIPLPPPPASVPSTFILLPPEADDTAIREKWDIHTTSLGGAGAKIETKVRQVLNVFKPVLSAQEEKGDETNIAADESLTDIPKETATKRTIVALTARAPAGNKCVSVAEIVKRDLLAKGVVGIWQYTGCWTRLETYVPPMAKEARNTVQNGTASTFDDSTEVKDGDAIEDKEESAFETMQIEKRKLVRNAVCLVVYLAMEPVPRLRELYGEQVFRPEGKEKT